MNILNWRFYCNQCSAKWNSNDYTFICQKKLNGYFFPVHVGFLDLRLQVELEECTKGVWSSPGVEWLFILEFFFLWLPLLLFSFFLQATSVVLVDCSVGFVLSLFLPSTLGGQVSLCCSSIQFIASLSWLRCSKSTLSSKTLRLSSFCNSFQLSVSSQLMSSLCQPSSSSSESSDVSDVRQHVCEEASLVDFGGSSPLLSVGGGSGDGFMAEDPILQLFTGGDWGCGVCTVVVIELKVAGREDLREGRDFLPLSTEVLTFSETALRVVGL